MNIKKTLEALSAYRWGETQRYETDGHIGIPYEITVYYDRETHGTARAGFMTNGATPVILYVVNACVERIGTESDESIIKGMLSRGYAVAVADYLGSEEARSPKLDTSAMLLRDRLIKGEFFAELDGFESGKYQDSAIVPAGYDILMNEIFFSLDRHGTHGTLEKIVNVWNNDFRIYRKGKILKWTRRDGTRKPTQNGFDGSEPVWYADAEGSVEDATNGCYTKVQYTLAERITDCVKPDGSPLDLNLYIHVTYPTSPKGKVPVMAMFASTGTASLGNSNPSRPQFAGFLFGGYAAAVFDYAWIPMGREDHFGYFDGSSGPEHSVTGDNMSYATYTYNATQTVTAAMRYLRYLALSNPDVYRFDIDHVGSYGISKASWGTQLGAPALRTGLLTTADGKSEAEIVEHVNKKINSFVQMYYLEGHDGSTRYDNGITEDYAEDGFTVHGGEAQPWAVFDGYEISSGAQTVYSCCGGFVDYLCKEYSPLFITENLQDTCNTEYGQQNILVNLCRNLNVPSLWFEADIAHTFAIGQDARYGVDIYDAFFRFEAYYLKNAPVSVAYTVPAEGATVSISERLKLRFIGQVDRAEIERATVVDADGSIVKGAWEESYGGSEWSFLPYDLRGGKSYTLMLPATMTGGNGAPMGKEFALHFLTANEEISVLCGEDSGAIHSVAPSTVRIRVDNDAYNVLSLYEKDTEKWLGSVRVYGKGFYEIPIPRDAKKRYVVKENSAGRKPFYFASTETGSAGFIPTKDTVFEEHQPIDGGHALSVVRKTNLGKYKGGHIFYYNMEGALTMTHEGLIDEGAPMRAEDVGRHFVIKICLLDQTSRPIRFWMSNATSRADKRLDFDRVYYTFETRANEWCEYEIPYTVYGAKYGVEEQPQTLYVQFTPTGSTEIPVYVKSISSEEIFTDVCIGEIAVIER